MKALLKSTCLIATLLFTAQGCAADQPENPIVKMATTTSTENSGLLANLLPEFQKDSGYEVQVIAAGTGKALKMGQDGDVDVVLVHARAAEDQFVTDGYGEKRYDVMYNDFVILGPDSDPADLRNAKSATEALKKIATSTNTFVSRGDDSGTHKKEKKLWQAIETQPNGSWYREAGQGMGKVIQMAGELDAYTLSDRGTWLASEAKSPLKIAFEGDETLFNPYGIIAVSHTRHPDTNKAGAQAVIDWLISEKGQQMIGDFKVNDKQLFIPNADQK